MTGPERPWRPQTRADHDRGVSRQQQWTARWWPVLALVNIVAFTGMTVVEVRDNGWSELPVLTGAVAVAWAVVAVLLLRQALQRRAMRRQVRA